MNRVESGIENLEKLIDGGVPERNMVLASGDYGTGKTTLSLQFIAKGVSEYGELGVFVSFVDDKEEVIEVGEQFDWFIKRYLSENSIRFLGVPPEDSSGKRSDGQELVKEIISSVKEIGADRLALDGLEEFSKFFADEEDFKSGLAKLKKGLRGNSCTSLLTSRGESGVENMVDGVMLLHYDGGLEKTRAMEVKKMRRSAHTDRMCPFEITDKGLIVTGPPKNGE